MANFKNVVNKQEFIQVWMMIVHKCMSSYSFRILIIQRHMLITAIKGYWSHIKIFFVPYTYGQTHPSTSGIGAALQSRASAAILQRLAQAIPKNCQVKRLLRFLSITCHRPVGGTGHPLIHYEFDLCLCLGSSTLAGPPARIMNASKRYLYYRAHFS